MAKPAGRVYGDDVPDDVVDRLRAICAELPDAYEEQPCVGARWRVRKKTFAHVLSVADDGADPRIVLTFRSEGEERYFGDTFGRHLGEQLPRGGRDEEPNQDMFATADEDVT